LIRTLGTILKWAILLPIFIAVVLLAVANDQNVTVNLNPFDKTDDVMRVVVPLYQLGFLLFVIGVLFGALIAWNGRRRSHRRWREEQATVWQARSDRPEQRRGGQPSEASAFLPRPERG
jgi:hypothetical protein